MLFMKRGAMMSCESVHMGRRWSAQVATCLLSSPIIWMWQHEVLSRKSAACILDFLCSGLISCNQEPCRMEILSRHWLDRMAHTTRASGCDTGHWFRGSLPVYFFLRMKRCLKITANDKDEDRQVHEQYGTLTVLSCGSHRKIASHDQHEIQLSMHANFPLVAGMKTSISFLFVPVP